MDRNTDTDWAEQIGKPHAREIIRMTVALEAPYTEENTQDYELAEAWAEATGGEADEYDGSEGHRSAALEHLNADKRSSGWYDRQDQAREAIQEDALSLDVRSEWTTIGEPMTAAEFRIDVATGGPAVRIRGKLDRHGEPDRAWLEVQDWFKPWTAYLGEDPQALAAACLAYARAFCWEGVGR